MDPRLWRLLSEKLPQTSAGTSIADRSGSRDRYQASITGRRALSRRNE
ncbi:hypothetical protein [Streptomyces goshikiensis]|nr:hypothetical protein [Streptomyces goshikiensis]WBY24337.1 hypothetical protein PET44_01975 [Streptomyces goshikiensis]WSS03447.1 hypothetical protein OG224_03405 [Streptomyces goshikiensis]